MNCKYMNMLRVVRGNAFKLKIAVEAYTPSGRRIDSFALGEAVLKLDKNGTLTTKDYIILEGTTILVAFDGSESLGVYGFQMSGEYEGEAWRWANAEIFQIVETNAKANIPDGCVLLDDTYNMAMKIVLSGGDGVTFTPSVSEQGIISWTNDGGLPNPEPRNIRGPRGEQGPQGEVGPQGPRGQMGLRGQIGPKGDKGDKGDTGATPVLDVTASVDENVGNPMVVVESFGPAEHRTFDFQFKNLKGQKGETGATGPQGPQGQQGEPGNYTKPASGIPLSDLNGNVASGIVYDVTANNSGATFASLSALLSSGSLSTLIPTDVRKGGMQIRFVQSSDNKYVQFRYMPSDASTVATFTNTANWQGVDEVPAINSRNLVESWGVKTAVETIDYKLAFVNVYKKNATQGSSEQTYIDVSPIKGDVYIRTRISVEYDNTQTVPTLYVHYKGDGSSTYTSIGTVKPNAVVKVSAGVREIDRFMTYGNWNWNGTYYIDVYNDLEERLVDAFVPKPIDIQLTHKGYRNIADKGVTGKGEFSAAAATLYKLSPILNVGSGKVISFHNVTTNIPWLYVYKKDGTYDYYITDTPNTNAASGTNYNKNSEITLPNNVLAIQLCINTSISGWSCLFVPANAESLSIYTQNKVLDYSEEITIAKYMFNQGNEFSGGANWRVSDYIKVSKNDYIEIGLAVFGIAGDPFACSIGAAFFDGKYNIIGSIIRDTAGFEKLFYYGQVPSGTKYVKFGCNINELLLPYALVHKGSEDETIESVPDDVTKIPVTYNISGKNIVLFGDSITQGQAATDVNNDSYAGILRKMFTLEHGGNMNFGFCKFYAYSGGGYMVHKISSVNWTRNYADSSVLGGDSYRTSTSNAELHFQIATPCNYIKVCSQYASSFGTMQVMQENNILATIDLSTDTKIGMSDLIDVSGCDFTKDFIIKCVSGTVNASGVVCVDNADWWTYLNYGNSGAPASLFTGDLFDAQASDASVVIYALGVNGDWKNVYNSFESIKEQFKALNAVKVVLDVCNYSSAKLSDNMPKKALIRQLARYVGATYICVGDHYPKQSNGDAVSGFFNSDNIHPSDYGHQFIAELIAKNIGLSVNAKLLADMLITE